MKSLTAFVSVAFVAGLTLSLSAGQQPPAPRSRLFTPPRKRPPARPRITANCASCHQPTLVGQNEAPPLAGANFMTTWGKRTTKDLLEYMSATMPPGKPSLAEADYVNISAFILQYNGATAGTQALAAATAAPIAQHRNRTARSGAGADRGWW